MPPDEVRMKMKKEGKLPPRTFQERPINISNTGAFFFVCFFFWGGGRSLFSLSLSFYLTHAHTHTHTHTQCVCAHTNTHAQYICTHTYTHTHTHTHSHTEFDLTLWENIFPHSLGCSVIYFNALFAFLQYF